MAEKRSATTSRSPLSGKDRDSSTSSSPPVRYLPVRECDMEPLPEDVFGGQESPGESDPANKSICEGPISVDDNHKKILVKPPQKSLP